MYTPRPVRAALIRIENGTFYRHHPSSQTLHPNPPLFPNLNWQLFNAPKRKEDTRQFPRDPKRRLFNDLKRKKDKHPHWCVVGPSLSGKTTFLQILAGQHLCVPPSARSYPYLSTDDVPHHLRIPSRAIQYVGFDTGSSGGSLGPTNSTYMSARYESRREETDFSLRDYLLGNTELNPADKSILDDEAEEYYDTALLFDRVTQDLRLEPLLDLPVTFLSNGQGRRARIARALLRAPELLLLDEPFMGLDPPTVVSLSPVLRQLAERAAPRLILTARPQDPLPEWITHVMFLRADCSVAMADVRETVIETLRRYYHTLSAGKAEDLDRLACRTCRRLFVSRSQKLQHLRETACGPHRPETDSFGGEVQGPPIEDPALPVSALREMGRTLTSNGIEGVGFSEELRGTVVGVQVPAVLNPTPKYSDPSAAASIAPGEAIVEMDGCQVHYGDKAVLGNWVNPEGGKKGLVWTVRRGERWGVFGPNGSGKTTLFSLLCSDHPQTYSLPIRLFGRSRLPEPGSGELPLTFWDIQSRVGHSSPEIHQHMPRWLTTRRVLESAWADTFQSKAHLDDVATAKVDATLRWFERELNPGYRHGSSGGGDLAWASEYLFGGLSFSAQRVLLLLRAVIKNPDMVVLDEAFSGMDEAVRDKCMLFIAHGEEKELAKAPAGSPSASSSAGLEAVDSHIKKAGMVKVTGLSEQQALICISHVKEEVPDLVREWLCLPEAESAQAARFGRLDGPLRTDSRRWNEIWGMAAKPGGLSD